MAGPSNRVLAPLALRDDFGTVPVLLSRPDFPSTPEGDRHREEADRLSGLRKTFPKSEHASMDRLILEHREKALLEDYGAVLRGAGILDPRAARELLRNRLVLKLEGASGPRQAQIRRQISRQDGLLPKPRGSASRVTAASVSTEREAAKVLSQIQQDPEDVSRQDRIAIRGPYRRPSWPGENLRDLGPTPRHVREFIDKSLIDGVGGLVFSAQSPPGPGRLVRIPFYPLDPADSWTGATGISAPGDDPVLRIRLRNADDTTLNPSGFASVLRPYSLQTERFDYGAYRVVGIQCRFPSGYGPRVEGGILGIPDWQEPFSRNTINTKGLSVSITSLNLYNGQQLLLPLGEMDARSIDLSGASGAGLSDAFSGATPARTAPYVMSSKLSVSNMGLRDYPVLDGNSRVFVGVSAFTSGLRVFPTQAPAEIELPFTIHLIAEIVEDRVFGDIAMPSTASRPGAMLKLAARHVGANAEGVPQLHVVNPTFRRGPKST